MSPAAAFLAEASLAAVPGDSTSGAPMLVGILAVWFIGYAISIVIHPYRKCKVCNGTGKHVGAIYGRGFRPCRNCGGSSRRPRLGTRVREWRR